MKIVHDTPEYLVLQHRPVFLSAALLAATLYLAYAGLNNAAQGKTTDAILCLVATLGLMGPGLWFAVERVDVIFSAPDNRCKIRRTRMSGNHSEDHPLTSVTRAMLQTHKASDGGADSHRVALVIGAEKLENRHGLTRSYSSGAQAASTVERINAWLGMYRA